MNSDIRVSTDLRNHPKVRTLAKNLNITRAQAVGHLVLLWSSAAIYKPDGVLSGLDPVDLAEFAGISEKKAVHFQTNLINLHFLDVNPATGEVSLHNWEIHQSYVIHAPERAAQAKRAAQLRWFRENHYKKCPGKYAETCSEHCPQHIYEQCPWRAQSNAPYPNPNPTTPYPNPNPTTPYPNPNPTTPYPKSGSSSNIYQLFKNEFGKASEHFQEEMNKYDEKFPDRWIIEAFKQTVDASPVKPWSYMKQVLNNWESYGEIRLINGNGKGDNSDEDKIRLIGLNFKCTECDEVQIKYIQNTALPFIHKGITDIASLKISPCDKCGARGKYEYVDDKAMVEL